MKAFTTLNTIRKYSPCAYGWTKLLAALNKTKADDELVSLEYILNSNGLDDAIWCLRAIEQQDQVRLFAVDCVRQPEVFKLLTDDRSIKALEVAEAYAKGTATKDDLESACTAAREAAREAARSAYTAHAAHAADAARAAWSAADAAAHAAVYAAAYTSYAADAAAAYAAAKEYQKTQFIQRFCS